MSNKNSAPLQPTMGGYNSSAFDGISVKNMYFNPQSQRVILYDGTVEGAYDQALDCKTGVANIDNICSCPGSANSSPFVKTPDMLPKLFVPEQPSLFPPTNFTAKCLMAMRQPINVNAGYSSYLGPCNN